MTECLLRDESNYQASQSRGDAGGEKIAPTPINTYRAEIEAFGEVILEGKPNPISGELGLRNQKMLAACYESARSGRVVEVG